jgi:hypothetical protein
MSLDGRPGFGALVSDAGAWLEHCLLLPIYPEECNLMYLRKRAVSFVRKVDLGGFPAHVFGLTAPGHCIL